MIHRNDYTSIMTEKLPEGRQGTYSITKRTLEKGSLLRTYTPAGYFYIDCLASAIPIVRLTNLSNVVMTDTPMEQEGLKIPISLARGKVLIVGLGIGLYPTMLLQRNKRIDSIVIVEQSKSIVKLVYPHIKSRKISLHVGDAEAYLAECKDKYDFIFIDIWPAVTVTIKEVDKWTELAKPYLAEGGEVRCWLQELYDRIKEKLPKEPTMRTGLAAIHEPCLVCGKKLRFDYAGLCMDCADDLEVSDMYVKT